MVDQLDPDKYHVLTEKGKKKLIFVSLVFVLVVLPVMFFGYYAVAVKRPSQTAKEANIEIHNGDSIIQVARTLHEAEAINSEFLFIFHAFITGSDNKIQAGIYKIDAGTNIVDVISILQHGTNDVKITFLEGWRVEEFARQASSIYKNVDYYEFIKLSQNLEGYLFPDTYFFNKDMQEEELVEALKVTFLNKTKNILSEENLKKIGLTRDQCVVLASLVEREARTEDDKRKIAGILIKRFKEGMKLDVDATTQYAVAPTKVMVGQNYSDIEWWPTNLSAEDLKSDNSYNTRLHVGLPPSPISSVSISSLESVINYEPTDYYYYLTDSNGVTHYAKTLTDHNDNIDKYLNP